MRKLIHHTWVKQANAFKTHVCSTCNVTRHWDKKFQRLVFETKKGFVFNSPKCKSTYLNDKI
jgi:hypothetical protein